MNMRLAALSATICLVIAIALTIQNEEHTETSLGIEDIADIEMTDGDLHTHLTKKHGRWFGKWEHKVQSPTSSLFLTTHKFNALVDTLSHIAPMRDLGEATQEKIKLYQLSTEADALTLTTAMNDSHTVQLGRKGYGRSEQYILHQNKIWLVERKLLDKIIKAHQKFPETQILAGQLKSIKYPGQEFTKQGMKWVNKNGDEIDIKPLLQWEITHMTETPPKHIQTSANQQVFSVELEYADQAPQSFTVYKDKTMFWVKSSLGYWAQSTRNPFAAHYVYKKTAL